MTKKDYVLIADRFKTTKATYSKNGAILPHYVIDDLALALSEALQRDNPRFDEKRFLEACNFTNSKAK